VFYSLFKLYARLAIKIYCPRIVINHPEVLEKKGPLLLASNHPNSFLDGIILTTLFDQPVHALARGDAFKIKWVDKFLRRIQLLPVYRSSEGVENLEYNYTTFSACQQTFKENGIILIFSEGGSENEWHLRPLKKGTARLAISAWQDGVPLEVLPVAFNYSSFKRFGKIVHLNFGQNIKPEIVLPQENSGRQLNTFNHELRKQLHGLVYEIDPKDKKTIGHKFFSERDTISYLLPLAIAGWVIHAPLFYPVKLFTDWRFKNSDHYDAVLHSLFIILYPVYIILLILVAYQYIELYSLLLIILTPLTAWACTRCKLQFYL
jgi:1-acyl-sn-glycerol-3-phosphate acyltransferase